MEGLTEILIQATQRIEQNYFCLSRYEDVEALRERHYCYELYHQMRCLWPERCRYILSGEIDKRSHEYLGHRLGSFPIPDFLIHTPGTMDNDTIIEVKTTNLQAVGIKKDLTNLSIFIERAGYKRAIFLIFGDGFTEIQLDNIQTEYSTLKESGNNLQPIEVWLHHVSGYPANHLLTLS